MTMWEQLATFRKPAPGRLLVKISFFLAAAASLWGQNTPWLTTGNVGIGTTTPTYSLDVYNGQANGAVFRSLGGNGGFFALTNNSVGTLTGRMDSEGFDFTGYGNNTLHIDPLGNRVGIGTTAPASTLDVDGTITAKEVIVSGNAVPDYVFRAGYRNRPLREVAAYIQENHHLPGIPSAEEAQKDGLSLGDMQKKMLEKIEELTLHMIDAEKRTDQLAENNERLAAENRELRERLAKLERTSK